MNLREIFNKHNKNITDFIWYNFEGTESAILSDATQIKAGGISLWFYQNTEPLAFVWLRPSGTEAVVRIIADAVTDPAPALERELIGTWKHILERIFYPK